MDVFTDVDIFKELVDASARGVPVYVLLDHSQFKSFLTMAESQDIHIRKLPVMYTFFFLHSYSIGYKAHWNYTKRTVLVHIQYPSIPDKITCSMDKPLPVNTKVNVAILAFNLLYPLRFPTLLIVGKIYVENVLTLYLQIYVTVH